jgi:hypothetical protein
MSGIAITRGAASALTFCYSILLLTVCRNLLSKMKELSLHQYIPLDSNIQVSSPSTSTYRWTLIFRSALPPPVHTAGL